MNDAEKAGIREGMKKPHNSYMQQKFMGGAQARGALIGALIGIGGGALVGAHKGLSARLLHLISNKKIPISELKNIPWATRALVPMSFGAQAGVVGGMMVGAVKGHKNYEKWRRDSK